MQKHDPFNDPGNPFGPFDELEDFFAEGFDPVITTCDYCSKPIFAGDRAKIYFGKALKGMPKSAGYDIRMTSHLKNALYVVHQMEHCNSKVDAEKYLALKSLTGDDQVNYLDYIAEHTNPAFHARLLELYIRANKYKETNEK